MTLPKYELLPTEPVQLAAQDQSLRDTTEDPILSKWEREMGRRIDWVEAFILGSPAIVLALSPVMSSTVIEFATSSTPRQAAIETSVRSQNPSGSGSCESFGGTVKNLGSLSLQAGSSIYNANTPLSRVAGHIPPNANAWTWEFCEVPDPDTNTVRLGLDAKVLGRLIGEKLHDEDNRVWLDAPAAQQS